MSAVYDCFEFSVAKLTQDIVKLYPTWVCCKSTSLDNDEKNLIGTDIAKLFYALSVPLRVDSESVPKTNSNDRKMCMYHFYNTFGKLTLIMLIWFYNVGSYIIGITCTSMCNSFK